MPIVCSNTTIPCWPKRRRDWKRRDGLHDGSAEGGDRGDGDRSCAFGLVWGLPLFRDAVMLDPQPAPVSRERLIETIGGDTPRCHIADNFALYCLPWTLSRFLMRYELLRRVLGVHGSIIECGVKQGAGLLQWFQLSRMLEPHNGRRIVYGFDTFDGLASVDEKDGKHQNGEQRAAVASDTEAIYDHLMQCI